MGDAKNQKITIIDGSFGSQLGKYVEKPIDGDPLWSARSLATNQEAVTKVHLDYIKAGADIIETNSYQASIQGFVKYLNLTKEESYDLIKKSVDLAKAAIEQAQSEGILDNRPKPLIAGSLGPYGAYLHDGSEYSGEYIDGIPIEALKEYHEPKIAALVEGGVDLFAIETIPSRREAEVIINLIKKYPHIKAWVSFSCQVDSRNTAHGDVFGESAVACYEQNPEQIIAVGVNCIAPHSVEGLLKDLRRLRTDIPLIVYANSGEHYNPNTGWDNNFEKLEDYVPAWLNLGVKYIGGCCRICDDYLVKIIEEVRRWEKKRSET